MVIQLLCDNEGAICLSDHNTNHNRTKHIDIQHHFVREHIHSGAIKVNYISTKEQLADILTKPLDRPLHELFITKLLVNNNQSAH